MGLIRLTTLHLKKRLILAAANFLEIKRDFDKGIEQRKKEQTSCDDGLTDLNPVRECYFNIEKIKN